MNSQLDRLRKLQKLGERSYNDVIPGVITFTSGKGGTGKTVISLNTAYAISLGNKKVLFIDNDFNFSNAHILLNRIVRKSIAEFYTGRALLNECITEITPRFHFIAGNSGSENYLIPNVNTVKYFITSLKNISLSYDVIIIDSSSGASDAAIELFKSSDNTVIVTTPEPTAVLDAYVMLKILASNNKHTSAKIVINKCKDESEATATAEKLIKAVNHFMNFTPAIIGYVPDDPSVNKSVSDQKLFFSPSLSSAPAVQITDIAAKLIKNGQLANIMQTEVNGLSK